MPVSSHTDPEEHDDLGVRELLRSFSAAMAAGNTAEAVSLWETPVLIISDSNSRVLHARTELYAFFNRAKDHYNAEGASSSPPDVSSIHWTTGTIAIAEVRWPHLDEESNELGSETWSYVLRRGADRHWKICVGIVHGAGTNWTA